MKGFKDSTRTKYMCGGPVKKFAGGVMEEGSMTPGGVAPKKAMPKGMGQMTDREMQMLKEAAKKPPVLKQAPKEAAKSVGQRASNAAAGAAAGAGAGAMAAAAARAATKAIPRGMGAMSDREMQMLKAAAEKKGVPAHSSKPMIRRNKGGLMAMPKGKCK